MTELDVQRAQTVAFIAANPTVVTLVPRIRVRQASGAWMWQNQPAKDPQVMRLIPQASASVLRLDDGTERRIEYQVLAEWDADIAYGDTFTYSGDTLEVVQLEHHLGYEVRAQVTRQASVPIEG